MMCMQTTTSLISCYWWGVSFVTLPSILLLCLALPAVHHSFSPSIIVPHSQSIITRTTSFVVPSIILHESNSVYDSSRTSSPTSKSRTSRSVALRQSQGDDSNDVDDDDDDDEEEEEKPNRVNTDTRTGDDNESKNNDETEPTAWIQQAMGTTNSERTPTSTQDTVDTPPALPATMMITQNGVAGFAVDSELGFVCLIAHHDDANDDVDDDADDGQPQPQQHRFVPVVISTLDRTTVQSAEALCLIQLVGGLDLGAVVFPPDILARLVAAELKEENEEESDESDVSNNNEARVEDLRTRVTLLAMTVVRDNDDDDCGKEEDPMKTATSTTNLSPSPPPSSPERTANIDIVSSKVLTAVQKLRGLSEVTAEQVLAAMQVHADAEGILDRLAFSEVLDTLRRRDSVEGGGGGGDGTVKFRLTASIVKEGDSDAPSTTSLVDFSATAFESIGLALRYQVTVTVSENDGGREEGGGSVLNGVSQVVARFPYFRPVQELKEDAKIMDGLIPSMFFKEKPPENQDKA